ncbi:hypothetical protein K474DRAFT_641850 [Panus rudis PR-1116 ss-1]|nr:hypothetical protein K474DRAFT_641850 [Panus rudis PR-1116 ss-1]
MSAGKDAVTTNQRLFPLFRSHLSDPRPEVYVPTAEKLALWLSRDKAYYDYARPIIIELLEIAQKTLAQVADDVNGPQPFHISRCPEALRPLVDRYVELIATAARFYNLFPEPHLRARLQALIFTIRPIAPAAPPTARPQSNPRVVTPNQLQGSQLPQQHGQRPPSRVQPSPIVPQLPVSASAPGIRMNTPGSGPPTPVSAPPNMASFHGIKRARPETTSVSPVSIPGIAGQRLHSSRSPHTPEVPSRPPSGSATVPIQSTGRRNSSMPLSVPPHSTVPVSQSASSATSISQTNPAGLPLRVSIPTSASPPVNQMSPPASAPATTESFASKIPRNDGPPAKRRKVKKLNADFLNSDVQWYAHKKDDAPVKAVGENLQRTDFAPNETGDLAQNTKPNQADAPSATPRSPPAGSEIARDPSRPPLMAPLVNNSPPTSPSTYPPTIYPPQTADNDIEIVDLTVDATQADDKPEPLLADQERHTEVSDSVQGEPRRPSSSMDTLSTVQHEHPPVAPPTPVPTTEIEPSPSEPIPFTSTLPSTLPIIAPAAPSPNDSLTTHDAPLSTITMNATEADLGPVQKASPPSHPAEARQISSVTEPSREPEDSSGPKSPLATSSDDVDQTRTGFTTHVGHRESTNPPIKTLIVKSESPEPSSAMTDEHVEEEIDELMSSQSDAGDVDVGRFVQAPRKETSVTPQPQDSRIEESVVVPVQSTANTAETLVGSSEPQDEATGDVPVTSTEPSHPSASQAQVTADDTDMRGAVMDVVPDEQPSEEPSTVEANLGVSTHEAGEVSRSITPVATQPEEGEVNHVEVQQVEEAHNATVDEREEGELTDVPPTREGSRPPQASTSSPIQASENATEPNRATPQTSDSEKGMGSGPSDSEDQVPRPEPYKRTVVLHRAKHVRQRKTYKFEISHEQMEAIALWNRREDVPDDMTHSLALTLSVHSQKNCVSILEKSPDADPDSAFGDPVKWQTQYRIQYRFNDGAWMGLYPPFISTKDHLVDLSQHAKEGENTFEIYNEGGLEEYMYMIQVRNPSAVQLAELQDSRGMIARWRENLRRLTNCSLPPLELHWPSSLPSEMAALGRVPINAR